MAAPVGQGAPRTQTRSEQGEGVLEDHHTHPARTLADLPPAAHAAHVRASMGSYAASPRRGMRTIMERG